MVDAVALRHPVVVVLTLTHRYNAVRSHRILFLPHPAWEPVRCMPTDTVGAAAPLVLHSPVLSPSLPSLPGAADGHVPAHHVLRLLESRASRRTCEY